MLHPDPDHMDYLALTLQGLMLEAIASVHIDQCDGCCHEPVDDIVMTPFPPDDPNA